MLIISHDDHIVRHNPLFFSVIMIRIVHRHIIVHRKHNAVFPAGNRQLSDKLDKRLPRIQTDVLEIDIDAVQPVLQCRIDQPVYQALPGGKPRKNLIGIYPFMAEIIDQSPDFQPHVMSRVNIIRRCKAGKIPFIVAQCKPCGRNHINALRGLHQRHKRVIACRTRYHMPCKIDLMVTCIRLVHRLHIISHRLRLHCGLPAQPLILHITDKGAFRLHLAPLLHFFQYDNFRSLRNIRQNITFHASLIAYLRILEYGSGLSGIPLRINLHTVRLRIERIGEISILFHKICRDIQRFPLISGYDIISRTAVAAQRYRPFTDQCTDNRIRQRIQQQSLFLVFKKSVIKIFVNSGKVKVAHALNQLSVFLDPLILQNNRYISLSSDTKILRQICSFPGIRIFLYQSGPDASACDHSNKNDRNQYRNYLLHLSRSFLTVLIIANNFFPVIIILTIFGRKII